MSVVVPGVRIGQKDQVAMGIGVYQENNQVYVSTFGTLLLQKGKADDGKEVMKANVKNTKHPAVVLKVGDIVIGQIFRIREDGAYLKILQQNDVRVVQHLEGQIKRQHIREKMTDDVKVNECYIPGDIVRAKFVSFGDGKRIYLSTAAEDLGVLYAKSQVSGKMMLPFSWTQMVCLKSGVKEKRKVAKPVA